MSTQRTSRARPNPPLGLFAIGAGLLLVGLLAFFALPGDSQETRAQSIGSVPVPVDYPAPALRLEQLQGGNAALADYAGQVVLVNFWATWCPPCKAEMPTLQAYYEAHRAEGFILVAVNAGDPAAEVQAFVDKIGLTFPVWLDPETAGMRAFRTMGLPSSYVIDRAGQVRLAWSGEIAREALEKYVTPIIQE
jgi:thiol-disulfide isomerase/thioredoxin